MDTYTRAYNVFNKLWEEEFGPWLQLILQNVLWAFIENQGYTLADVPMFLNHRNIDFRNHIVDNIKYNSAVADFWRYEFFERKEPEQQARVEAALTRINTLLTHPDVRDIVGQEKTTIDFGKLLSQNNIILLKLSANLAEDVKKFIGTILLSEFVFALRARPEGKRSQYCIFVDEFHNFASTDHMATMVTEGRKFGVASTFLHVERFGQLAHNQKLMGATQAIVNKVLFQATVADAKEFAPEFAKEVTVTETRVEPELVISQEPYWDLLRRGHTNPRIQEIVRRYLQSIWDAYQEYQEQIDSILLTRTDYQNQATLFRDQASLSGIDERREREFASLARGRAIPISHTAMENTEAALQHTMQAHNLARNQTRELQNIYIYIKELREYIQQINRYITAVMQGRTSPIPKKEPYVNHLIDMLSDKGVNNRTTILQLYLRIQYGDTKAPQRIPIYLTVKYWPEQVKFAFDKGEVISNKLATRIQISDDPNQWSWESKQEFMKTLGFVPTHHTVELDDLPARRLLENEIEEIKEICHKELSTAALERIEDYIELFTLLSQPENHIKVPSGQYVEKPVHIRQVHDMTDEMTQELTKLPRYQAYTKLIDESQKKQVVRTHRIETHPLPKITNTNMEAQAITNGYTLGKERDAIDEEIRTRQSRWQGGTGSPQTKKKRE